MKAVLLPFFGGGHLFASHGESGFEESFFEGFVVSHRPNREHSSCFESLLGSMKPIERIEGFVGFVLKSPRAIIDVQKDGGKGLFVFLDKILNGHGLDQNTVVFPKFWM